MEAKLKILTKQYDEVGNIDTIEVNTIGKMFEKNKDIYIVYEESEENQKVTTTLKISEEEVSIKRFGNVNSLMIFKENHKNLTKYKTNQGLFVIETETNKLTIDKSKNNYIKLNIEYNINILDLFKGKNEINILNKNIEFLKTTSKALIVIPLILMLPIVVNFEGSFVLFHKIMFNNDYWIFDPNLDPVINILPEEFFFHAGLMILILIIIASLTNYLIYRFLKREQ